MYDSVRSEVESILDLTYAAERRGTDKKLTELYELAKKQQWNAATAINWQEENANPQQRILEDERMAIYGTRYWDQLDEEGQIRLNRDWSAYTLSQILDAEQAALLICGQLVNVMPKLEQKLCAAVQLLDEARHVEVFRRYLDKRLEGKKYPMNPSLLELIRLLRADKKWHHKLVGMQLIIEGIAISSFRSMLASAHDPLIKKVVEYVLRDESRHIAFGVIAIRETVSRLANQDREDLARFAYETVIRASGRYFPREIYQELGFGKEEIEEISRLSQEGPYRKQFLQNLFSVVMVNIKQAELITPMIRHRYQESGLL